MNLKKGQLGFPKRVRVNVVRYQLALKNNNTFAFNEFRTMRRGQMDLHLHGLRRRGCQILRKFTNSMEKEHVSIQEE